MEGRREVQRVNAFSLQYNFPPFQRKFLGIENFLYER